MLPRHVPWADPEPAYKGKYKQYTVPTETVVIGAGGYTDFDIEAANINFIYRLLIDGPGSAYNLKLFDKADRAVADLAWQTETQTNDYNSVTDYKYMIAAVDKDGTNEMHFRLEGIAGASFDIDMDIVRLS